MTTGTAGPALQRTEQSKLHGIAGGAAASRNWPEILLGAILLLTAGALPAPAQTPPIDELLSGIVRIKTFIAPEGRTVENLGHERTGSGIFIDDSGLILTIGYLMVEAQSVEVTTHDGKTAPATVLGYDNDTGFGLLKASKPAGARSFVLGKSSQLAERDPVLAASFGGMDGVAPAVVAARREFAGAWEYLIDDAIFTTPAHNDWSGAALIDRDGKLVGVGSLVVPDVTGRGENAPGNMYVPIDLLTPVLADLIVAARGRGTLKPWLGLTTEEVRGRLFVVRVAPDSPAQKAGIARGDMIVGVEGAPAGTLADFYRKIWARGKAGATVPLDVLKETSVRRIDVKSMNRLDHLRLKSAL